MIERIYLNFNWTFEHDGSNKNVNIPHTVKEIPFNYANEDDYQFVSTYTKKIEIDEKYKGKHFFLTFDGVAHKSEIYLNDNLILTHIGGYDSFFVDLKDNYQFGKENILKVVVDSTENPNIPPFGNVVDYYTYGGIYRDVYLDICDDSYVKDVFMKVDRILIISSSLILLRLL